MSVIAGLLHRDGQPAAVELVERMLGVSADRTPDGGGSWCRGPAGLGCCALHTAGPSTSVCQPVVDERSGLTVVLAGRLDNRDDVASRLDLGAGACDTATDAHCLLQAYLRWGDECPEYLSGDFAFAVWDATRRRVFCARDLVGARPLHYVFVGDSFIWGSELRQVLAFPGVARRPNEGMAGEHLVDAVRNSEETLFEGVMRLPPGCCLEIGEHGDLRVWRWWNPARVRTRSYRDAQQYVDELRHLVDEAVSARLRSDDPVAVQLSGGVDSSIVAMAAARLRGSGLAPGSPVSLCSMVFPGWACDETPFIDEVVARSGLPAFRAAVAPIDVSACVDQVRRYCDLPDYPNGAMSNPLKAWAHSRGVRVMLTGLGGDEWFQRSDGAAADLLRSGRLLALARWLREWPPGGRLRPHRLWGEAIRPLVPDAVTGFGRRLFRRHRMPDWLDESFVRRTNLLDRIRPAVGRSGFESFAQSQAFAVAIGGGQTRAMEMEERSAGSFHLELRHPFHDRRIIEFGLALPDDMRWQDGVDKWLLRRAMREDLPQAVATRRGKAEFSQVFVEALRQVGRSRFESLRIATAGWVNERRILRMYDGIKGQPTSEQGVTARDLWTLWHVFGLELWFAEAFGKGEADC